MLTPISIEKFADGVVKNNKEYNRRELIQTLRETLDAKKKGAKCMISSTLCLRSVIPFSALSMRMRLPFASLPSDTRWVICPLRVRMKSLPKSSTVSDIAKPR